MNFSWKRFLVTTILFLGLFIGSSSNGHAWSSTEKREMPYYTCYGVSNIMNNSQVGVMGESTTICDRTTMFPAYKVYVSGTMLRDQRPVDSDNTTLYKTDSAKVQLFYSDGMYRSGKYHLTSTHQVVSGYNHGHSIYWNSEWVRNFY